ncbi:MAG: hypothetical protein ABFD92_00025 [Planctomycetaceae bacterium]|nr:hypothetical protein [Planctomycetaceae bacterium]
MDMPKVALKFEQFETRHAFGAVDEIELTPGMMPNVFAIRMKTTEFGKFYGTFDRDVDVEIFLSDPDTPDVTLVGWHVDYVEDSLYGRLPGEAAYQVLEKTLYIADRRWEFTDGRGGNAFIGLVNRVTASGKSVENIVNGLAAGGLDVYGVLELLIGSVANGGGLMQFTSDQPAYKIDSIDEDSYTALAAMPKPRDLKLDGAHVPSAVNEVLDAAGAVWSVKTDGTYQIHAIGVGAEPVIDAALALPADAINPRSTKARAVVITSAPRRRILQETIFGVDGNDLEYVGVDSDGKIKPLDQLSYITATGKTAKAVFQGLLVDITDAAKRALALSSLYRMIRLSGVEADRRVPILSRAVDSFADSEGAAERPAPVRVWAKRAVQRPTGMMGQNLWFNCDDWVEITGFNVDWANGVISFYDPIGRVADEGFAWLEPGFEPLAANQFKMTFAHEKAQSGATFENYFAKAYRLNQAGVVEVYDLATALSPAAKDIKVISMPELVEMRTKVAGEDEVSLNGTEVEAAALAVATRVLSPNGEVKKCIFKGFHDVSPNGNISGVKWSMRECTTEYELRNWYVSKSRYMDKAAMLKSARAAQQALSGANNAPAGASMGTRDYAPAASVMGAGNAAASGGAQGGVAFGKIKVDWSYETSDRVIVQPCDSQGNLIPDAAEVTAILYQPLGYDHDAASGFVAGEVVTFIYVANEWGVVTAIDPLPSVPDRGVNYTFGWDGADKRYAWSPLASPVAPVGFDLSLEHDEEIENSAADGSHEISALDWRARELWVGWCVGATPPWEGPTPAMVPHKTSNLGGPGWGVIATTTFTLGPGTASVYLEYELDSGKLRLRWAGVNTLPVSAFASVRIGAWKAMAAATHKSS